MAHFAKLDADNIVLQVIVVNNEVILNTEMVEDENLGITFCKNLFGEDTNWIQTSFNNRIRKQYAGIGFTYNSDLDMFILPKCHNEAVLNELGDWDCDNTEHGAI